jgi:signal transduction histidine kinase
MTGSMAPRESVRPGGTALAVQLTLSAVFALAIAIIWAATGMGYFWPMWPWFALALALALHAGIRWAWAEPRGRSRQLAMQGVLSAILAVSCVLIWAMSGGGFFWPVFPLLGLGLAYAVHAALRSPRQPELAGRVDELTRTRRGALDVQAAELRRIERDLHDGAQARLVALSMQLGRAEERLEGQPETAALVRRAREEAGEAIAELRDLARGIAPPVLADRGLVAAVQALADRSPSVAGVRAEMSRRAPPVVEAAAYFVVAEALTNAAKHAPNATVQVAIRQSDTTLVVEVADDGSGGADPGGSGVTGLRQRVEALDGELTVRSPPGHGTTVRAVLPCG